jgi:hypothetical protein
MVLGLWCSLTVLQIEPFDPLCRPLFQSYSVSENALSWSGYRLRKARMQFTCDYQNSHAVNTLDYLQMSLEDTSYIFNSILINSDPIFIHHGKIGSVYLNSECQFSLRQSEILLFTNIHAIYSEGSTSCTFTPPTLISRTCTHYFGNYNAICMFVWLIIIAVQVMTMPQRSFGLHGH